MSDLPYFLAEYKGEGGYVVAPAGYGKTHLIAESTALCSGRQLILTHTYAGVHALRRKMRVLGVCERLYRIDTIASWALRLSLAYPEASGWSDERPADSECWNSLYIACANLLDHEFVRRIIRASYNGLYVDEYQDCSIHQHAIVVKLAKNLPCRILGDPLQSIFDFDGQNPVDWRSEVQGGFECLGELKDPHRWIQAGASDLGLWLKSVRDCLEQDKPIDLNVGLPKEVRILSSDSNPRALVQAQSNVCRYFECGSNQKIIAIHKGDQQYKAKCHSLSRSLAGRFSSIEEVEGKDLFLFIRKLEDASNNTARLKEVIEFSKRCMTGVTKNLPAGTSRGEHVDIRTKTRNPEVAREANVYLLTSEVSALRGFLLALKETEGVNVFRGDLFFRAIETLNKSILNPGLSLKAAAERFHVEFRHKGRPIGRSRLIGTMLLVKGLEFDHAIVLDAASLSKKELYVALTRGSRTLTIVSTTTVLSPRT